MLHACRQAWATCRPRACRRAHTLGGTGTFRHWIAVKPWCRYVCSMAHKLVVFATWAAFGLICLVTLSPMGLRPETGSVGLEHFLAYALLGALFIISYPHQYVRLAIFVVAVALGLEALQQLTPDRHARLTDALLKAAGGLSGCAATRLVQMVVQTRPKN